MAVIPNRVALSGNAYDILNVIRENASINYREYVPEVQSVTDIQTIGNIFMNYVDLRNEFVDTLVNRIAFTLIKSRLYRNPLALLKSGIMEYGESIEEIFVDLVKPHEFDPAVAEKDFMKMEKSELKTAFHAVNFRKFYKVTVSNEQLQSAFLNESGVLNLINTIIESVYASANYDEFLVMKYVLATNILNGRLYPVAVSANDSDTQKNATAMKGVSNSFEFMSTDYNVAGVHNYSDKSSQYIIMSSDFDSKYSVDVLAGAFNMSKAEFLGNRLMIDGFGKLDTKRLAELFKGDPNYKEISEGDLKLLNAVPAVLIDKGYFVIYDKLVEMDGDHNYQGLYYNYAYHKWSLFSTSPFANAVVFTTVNPSVTAVKVTPTEITLNKGSRFNLSTNVETLGFAPQTVSFASSSEDVEVGYDGSIYVSENAKASSATITVTSTFDPEKTAECTITINK